MSNSVNLSLDVTKTGIQNPLIKVRQGDGGFETLHTTVTSNGEPLSLQGWTITFMGTTAGNHKIVDTNVTIVEASNGVFDYTPSKAWGIDIGDFKMAYFKFVKGDGSASSADFRVSVIEAVDLTQEEAQNYISVVDATIADVRQRLTSSLANITASVAANSSAVSSLAVNTSSVATSAVDKVNTTASSAVIQVNSAASSASLVASNAANNVSTVANSAVANVNSAANVYVKKSGSETIDGDKTFLRPINGRLSTEPVNLFFNSEFENSLEGWNIISGGGNVSVTPGSNDTSGIAVVAFTLTSGYVKLGNSRLYQTSGNSSYSLSSLVNAGTASAVYFIVDEFDSNKAQVKSTSYGLTSSASWVLKTTSFVTQAQTKFVQVSYQVGGSSGQIAYASEPMWNVGGTPLAYVRGSEMQSVPNDANIVHKTGTETIAGDKTFTGNTMLTGIKSSKVNTGSAALNGLTFDFRQTAVGVNVYMRGTFTGTFGTDQSYLTSASVVPSNINNPKQPVVLTIVSNGGIGGVTANSPWELEVLIAATGAIQYRAKNLRDNDTTARSATITGAASAFYTIE